LQEGAGHAVHSAYVEVVFDNSDNRFPARRPRPRLALSRAAPSLLGCGLGQPLRRFKQTWSTVSARLLAVSAPARLKQT